MKRQSEEVSMHQFEEVSMHQSKEGSNKASVGASKYVQEALKYVEKICDDEWIRHRPITISRQSVYYAGW
jgi:hypothetical protein